MLASSNATRLATTHFSLQVCTNSRYFCRLSKKRKLRWGSLTGATAASALPACRARGFVVRSMTVDRPDAMAFRSADSEPRMLAAVNRKLSFAARNPPVHVGAFIAAGLVHY